MRFKFDLIHYRKIDVCDDRCETFRCETIRFETFRCGAFPKLKHNQYGLAYYSFFIGAGSGIFLRFIFFIRKVSIIEILDYH